MSSTYTLDPQLENFVQSQLASGRYSDAGEVVRDALRLMKSCDRRMIELDAALMQSMADVEAGHVYDLDDVCNELDAELAALPPS